MLPINTPAPEFSLPDQDGKIRNLSDYKGKKIILYFHTGITPKGILCTLNICCLIFRQLAEKERCTEF